VVEVLLFVEKRRPFKKKEGLLFFKIGVGLCPTPLLGKWPENGCCCW
jgi:hypothetical protein